MIIGFEQKIQEYTPDIFGEALLSGPVPLLYHDVLVLYSKVPLWTRHYEFFALAAEYLQVDLPYYFLHYDEFLSRLVNRAKFYKALVRVVFYAYEKSIRFVAIPAKIDYEEFLAVKDLVVFNLRDKHIITSPFDVKSYGPASIYINSVKAKRVFVDANGNVLQVADKAIIIRKGKKIISPDHTAGASYNVLQQEVLFELDSMGYEVERAALFSSDFDKADEVWLVDDGRGIYYRVGVEDNRYLYTDLAKDIIAGLNGVLLNTIE